MPSASTAEIIAELDALLEIDAFDDYGPNGLQVPGADRVTKLVTGVSAQRELFERAAADGAELVLTHHGTLWDAAPRRIDERMAQRLRTLLVNNINLAAYHLPLDAHPELGNNALLAAGLGVSDTQPFAPHRGRAIGRRGRFAAAGAGAGADGGIEVADLVERVRTLVGREPLVFDFGPARVNTIGIVSGGASSSLDDAIAAGLDAFLTGEPTERVMVDAKEAEITFIAAGHYATETFGIRRLGELVAERHGVEHRFVDLPNPI